MIDLPSKRIAISCSSPQRRLGSRAVKDPSLRWGDGRLFRPRLDREIPTRLRQPLDLRRRFLGLRARGVDVDDPLLDALDDKIGREAGRGKEFPEVCNLG